MGPRYLKDGEDFGAPHFSSDFGFSESSKGGKPALNHPNRDDGEFGDGSFVERMARGGHHKAKAHKAPKGIPPQKAAEAIKGAAMLGAKVGARVGAKVAPAMQAQPSAPPMGALSAMAGPLPAAGGAPMGMRRGGKMKYARGGKVACYAEGGSAGAKPKMNFDGGDHVFDSDGASQIKAASQQYEPGVQKMAKGGKFIQKIGLKKNALHKDLGVPAGQKIPAGKLAAAAKRPGKVGQRARFAETLKGFNK